MKHLTKYTTLALIFLIFGCSNSPESKDGAMTYEQIDAPNKPEPDSNTERELTERKLIKVGQVEFETDNLNSTRETVLQAVDKFEGYVSSDREFKTAGRISNTIVIRVPADSFDDLLKNATQGVEKFDSKEINVKDVTEEFLDVQARLKTKKELEARYLELLKQAKNVTEILAIEKQLGELRSEIESTEGRLKYLKNQVSYSTLTMTFYESIPNQTEFGEKFKKGLQSGWDNLIWFFVLLTHIWPFLLIGVAFIVGVKVFGRRKKKQQ